MCSTCLGQFYLIVYLLIATIAVMWSDTSATLMESLEQLKKSVSEMDSLLHGDDVIYDMHFNCLENCEKDAFEEGCDEVYTSHHDIIKGNAVFLINYSNLKPFYAFCIDELEDKDGWTVIQRREDGSENFYRNWLDYKNGFGDLYCEYWIGLERLHQITNRGDYELLITMVDFKASQRYAAYSTFAISNEDDGYTLFIGKYNGTAGDSLRIYNGAKFSTYDRDNDEVKRNCAQRFHGGWWYRDCKRSTINGPYHTAANKHSLHGVVWPSFHEYNSLQYTRMSIRKHPYSHN